MGVYLMKPNVEKNTTQGKNAHFEFAQTSMQGWRTTMEDAHICHIDIEENIHLFAVFDGHGGSEVAKFCEKYFVETLLKNQHFKEKNYEQALRDTYEEMDILLEHNNFALLKPFMEQSDFSSQAGCTAVVVLLTPDKYFVANAGDSRCVLFCKDQKVVPLTEDHKPDNVKEKKRIELAGGLVCEGRINGNLNLSRAIGDFEFKSQKNLEKTQQLIIASPDVVVRNYEENDHFLVIGCDGIWETMSTPEIGEFIQKSQTPLDNTAETLLDKLIAEDTSDGTGCDNMSCIIVKFLK